MKVAYPVDEVSQKDYRYVKYSDAMSWYDRQIVNFNQYLANEKGDKDIAFYFLRKFYANALKIERTLRR